jgi:hypothetical protein
MDRDRAMEQIAHVLRWARETDPLEDLINAAPTEHPLFVGSSAVTFYSKPTRQEQFPGWEQTIKRWAALNEVAFHKTRGRVLMNFSAMGTIVAMQMHALAEEQKFIEFVFANPDKHVFGYWFTESPKDAPLDALAAHTRNCLMVTRDRRPDQAWWLWSYEQLYDKNPESPLKQVIAELQQHGAGDITHIFMKDFRPADIVRANALFPKARLVGITTPLKDDAKQIEAILVTKARLAEQMKAAAAGNISSGK